MAKIYRSTDRVKIKITDDDGSNPIIVTVAPLTHHQKTEIQNMMLGGKSRGDLTSITKGIELSIKYSVKGVEGLTDMHGNDYKPSMEGDILSDESVSDLLNMDLSNKLIMVCSNLTSGFTSKFKDEKGTDLLGVEIVQAEKKT